MSLLKKMLKDKAKAVKDGNYKEAASVCNAIGIEYLNQEKHEEALQEHLEELEYCKLIEDQFGIAVANRRIGECYSFLKQFTKALYHIKKFYDISINLKSAIEEQRAWATFGRTYYLKYQHDYESGYEDDNSLIKTLDQSELSYYKALKMLPSIETEITPTELAEMKCRLLLNLGLVCEARGDRVKSSKYVKEGLEIALKNNLYEDIHRCSYALGTLYQKLGKHVKADDAFNQSLITTKKLHNKNLTWEVLLSKGINLISLEKYKEAKKLLKSAYKLGTTNSEDLENITRSLKVCKGLDNYENKLKFCKNCREQKAMLEKMADGLSSISCFNLAIKKYRMTLDCMEEAGSPLSEKAPIYFSLAETYFDNGNISKALEYFEKEYNCRNKQPLEQIQTLWKIAGILEGEKKTNQCEEFYRKAVLLAEETGNQKYIYNSLNKLSIFYTKLQKTELAENIRHKVETAAEQCLSDEEVVNDENGEPFNDISLSELSDSDNNEEVTTRNQNKKIKSKVNKKGETPLHQACISGNLCLVKRLVENGHSVNVRDYAGWTPLHEACNHGFYDSVDFLLKNGASINDPGGPECKGITALHDAASCGHLDIMQLLISKGASVTVGDEDGQTPLHELLQWKKRSLGDGDLDDVTLKQYKAVEDELKLKMAEAGLIFQENILDNSDITDSSDVGLRLGNLSIGRKRNRSFTSSSDSDYEKGTVRMPPYLNANDNKNLNSGGEGEAAYKAVMKNLQCSAANMSSIKRRKPEVSGPPLVNENEMVNDWLVKDTGKIPKTKSKKRRMNKLNVGTNQYTIDKYLISKDSPKEKTTSFSNDSSSSIKTDNSFDRNITKNNQNQQSCSCSYQKCESSSIAFCLRVNIAGKLILVPVLEDTCTVSWLKKEAALRFQDMFDGRKPHLTFIKDGAILDDSDLIKTIFSDNEEVLSSVEIWDEPSLEDQYVQLCNKNNMQISSGIKRRFSDIAASFELNLSNCCIPSSQLNIVFHTLLNYKSLRHLNLSCVPLSSSNISELVSCIPNLLSLLTLNLSCCSLTSEKIQIFLKYLTDQIRNVSILPSLMTIDLSYNFFPLCPNFVEFLKLNCLIYLNLSSCGLDSTFLSDEFLKAIKEKADLEELDISNNVFKSDEISLLLHHLPKSNLKKLNLRCVIKENVELGFKLQNFLMGNLPFLKELILERCFLTDCDINLIISSLSRCPQLQILDISANPSLSSSCVTNFIAALRESSLNITDLNITGTCKWESDHLSCLEDCLKLKKLKRLCLDNCADTVTKYIMQLWIEKWGDKALCTNSFFFCELSVK